MTTTRTAVLLTLLLGTLSSCSRDEGQLGIGGGGGSSSDGTDGGDTTDGGDDDSGDSGQSDDGSSSSFEAPGDIVDFQDDEGVASIDLTDTSDDPGSNRDQEFYMVLVNTGEDELGYRLRYEESDGEDARRRRAAATRRAAHLSDFRARLRDRIRSGALDADRTPLAPPPPIDASDIGDAIQEFHVRNDLEDETSGTTVRGKLWAVGDSVTIWVDTFMPFNVYNDCDDPSQGYAEFYADAFGFDNCDLAVIANIVDTNIVPTLTDAYGPVSDVNGDGRVSIVITPVLNRLTQGTDDETLQGSLVGSYADPEVDLIDYDIDENPLSDEQEVIFVHAPDPYGYFNNEVRVELNAYTGMELAAQIARAYTRLISFNNKVLADDAGGEPDDAWLVEGLGALAADLTGFGAVNYDDMWRYLDAPHLSPLLIDEDAGAITTESYGAQYLFLRWLVDNQEPADPSEGTLLQQLLTSTNVGMESIQSVTGRTFEDLVVAWQVALLTTGVLNVEGAPLVQGDPDSMEGEPYPPYLAATVLSAPTENPTAGDHYGANGYQQGVNIRGLNVYMEGGTTASPTPVPARQVLAGGTDHFTLATGLPFFGHVKENYAAQVIRLVDIPFDTANVVVDGNNFNFTGAVIRWNDPGERDYQVENVYSSTSAATVNLPRLDSGGATIYGLGLIGSPGATYVVDAGEAGNPTADTADTAGPQYESGDIYDTDRWQLDLSGFSPAEEYQVVVELSRHYGNADGDIAPADPWVAVVPANLVPTPTVAGTNNLSCPSASRSFEYPASIMEHLFWQVFLSPSAMGDTTSVNPNDAEDGSGFDPCGVPLAGAFVGGVLQTSCSEDWDRDGVLDADEPTPDSFVQQVQVMQCTLTKASTGENQLPLASYVNESIIDRDELDQDDASYFDRTRNLGGRSDEVGEDAFLQIWLRGGSTYVVVVGAGADEGPYEIAVRVLETRPALSR